MIADEARNDLIFNDLLIALDQGRSPILLTDRLSHLEYFQNRLKGFAKNIIVLRGGLGKKQLKLINEQLNSIPSNEERVLLATGRYAGEGFDDARLIHYFLSCQSLGTEHCSNMQVDFIGSSNLNKKSMFMIMWMLRCPYSCVCIEKG